MMLARFVPIVFTLAIAGALIRKRVAPAGLGTMRTDTPTFGGLVSAPSSSSARSPSSPPCCSAPSSRASPTQLF